MKKKWIVIACVGTLFALLPLWAQQRPWLEKRHSSIIVQYFVRDLNLSDVQRTQIKSILQNEQPTIQRLIERHEQLNSQLRSRSTYDDAFVRSVAQQQAGVAVDAIVEREKVRAQIMAVLNPEQQQKVDHFSEELRLIFKSRLAEIGNAL